MFIFQGTNLIRLMLAFLLIFPVTSTATIVRMQTSLGVIDIDIYEDAAPLTVENFLSYVDSGAYNYTFFHNNVPGSVIYAGKYFWESLIINPVKSIVTNPPVVNEFSKVNSNIRGTLAMAKDSSSPDSATSQFFFNVTDNSKGKLKFDTTNGGYTVFGKVVNESLPLIDKIASLPTRNAGTGFTALPLAIPLAATERSIRDSNLVMINTISSNRTSIHSNDSDRIFSLLELLYPEYLAPANPLDAVSTSLNGYYYRCYSTTNFCIGTSNGEVFYLSPEAGSQPVSLGSVSTYMFLVISKGY